MCAPFVMSSVREGLSRRGFLGAAVGCAAVVSVNAQQQPVRLPKGFRDVIDLTHPFSPALPVYPGVQTGADSSAIFDRAGRICGK